MKKTEKYSLSEILSNLKIEALNEMQLAAVEANKKKHDIVLLSATGSGKTLAYLLPILENHLADNKNTQALIVVPSRELAMQIEKVFKQMQTGKKITSCYGGHKREIEENNLVQAPAVIVGTPGRLGDHIRRGNITIDDITTLVLDEFDKSLELGFLEEMQFILDSLKNVHKKILTSATEAVEIPEFIQLNNPERLHFLSPEAEGYKRLEIKTVAAPDKDKLETLFQLLCQLGSRPSIIFSNHREAVERISRSLKEKGIYTEFYHGGMEQQQRDSALSKFRNGTSNILVTTDLAARGLDIPHIRYIIHYHLPLTEDAFVHRNGRTARMEASGTAILIIGPDENLPEYVDGEVASLTISEDYPLPEKPKWATLFIAAGKKDKVNKVDIVGFLTNKGQLKKDDIGLIEVKDFFSFVGIRKSRMSHLLHLIKNEKIKNKKVKMEVAK